MHSFPAIVSSFLFFCPTPPSPIRVQEPGRIGRVDTKKHRFVRLLSCTIRTPAQSPRCIRRSTAIRHQLLFSRANISIHNLAYASPTFLSAHLSGSLYATNLVPLLSPIQLNRRLRSYLILHVYCTFSFTSSRVVVHPAIPCALCHIPRLVAFFRTISSMLQHRTIVNNHLSYSGPDGSVALFRTHSVVYITQSIVHRNDIILYRSPATTTVDRTRRRQ